MAFPLPYNRHCRHHESPSSKGASPENTALHALTAEDARLNAMADFLHAKNVLLHMSSAITRSQYCSCRGFSEAELELNNLPGGLR